MNSFFKGLGFGITSGGILGLLFAPMKGSELRKSINDFADTTEEDVKQITANFKQTKKKAQDLLQTKEQLLIPTSQGFKKSIADYQFQSKPRIKKIQLQIDKIQKNMNKKTT